MFTDRDAAAVDRQVPAAEWAAAGRQASDNPVEWAA
jgi:hypothetical protein